MKRKLLIVVLVMSCFMTSCKKNMKDIKVFTYKENGICLNKQVDLSMENKDVVLKSKDESIAKITDNHIEGLSIGNTIIEAYLDNKLVDSCNVYVNDGKYNQIDGNEALIEYKGRSFKDNDGLVLNNILCGFETNFYGTSLTINAYAAGIRTTQLAIIIDGKESDNLISFDKTYEKQTLTLASNLEEKNHNIIVYKITEAYNNSLKITDIETDGYFTSKPLEKNLKIEFYGDSITVGHLNMRKDESEPIESERDLLQNGLKSYSYIASSILDADIRIQGRTGIGLYSCWGGEYTMLNAYSDTYCSEQEFLGINSNPKYDFNNWKADIVVINIGTNDVWYNFDEQTFRQGLKSLTKSIFKKYGDDTKIIYVYGIMTNSIDFQAEMTKDFNNVYSHKPLSYSISYHPLFDMHKEIGEGLADYIKTEILK